MSWTFVQHVHTRHSLDSLAEPAALVRRAAETGVEVLAITDHDTWRGAVDAKGAAERQGGKVRIVLGTEVRTDHGDVIGLFITSDVRERKVAAFCDAVHEQGGIVVLPHPYKWHRLEPELLERVDIIEVYNPRCSRSENLRAEELALERNRATLVGSDAHRVKELMLARTEFDGDPPSDEAVIKHALLHAPRRFFTHPPSIWNEWLSQSVKFVKRPTPMLAYGLVRGFARRMLKPDAYRQA